MDNIDDNVDATEDPSQRFRRLSQARFEQFTEVVRKISNLSNKANYRYSPEEVQILFDAMQEALNSAKRMFGEPERISKRNLWG